VARVVAALLLGFGFGAVWEHWRPGGHAQARRQLILEHRAVFQRHVRMLRPDRRLRDWPPNRAASQPAAAWADPGVV